MAWRIALLCLLATLLLPRIALAEHVAAYVTSPYQRLPSALQLWGEIREGDGDRLLRMIAASPASFLSIHYVDLRSPGGDLAEAMAIGQILRDAYVPVVVTGDCVGACFFVYAAAHERQVAVKGRLGLRSPGPDSNAFAELFLLMNDVPPDTIRALSTLGQKDTRWLENDAVHALGGLSRYAKEWMAMRCGHLRAERASSLDPRIACQHRVRRINRFDWLERWYGDGSREWTKLLESDGMLQYP
jgi:hypothetical protein